MVDTGLRATALKTREKLAVRTCIRQMAFFGTELFMPFNVTNDCRFNNLV
jgi:hypothetical protein